MQGLSLVAASGGHSSSRCAGLSPSRPLSLRSTGSRRAGSVIVAHGPSRSAARGILPAQGSNPCPLHWQADSQPLRHQGSPVIEVFINLCILACVGLFFTEEAVDVITHGDISQVTPESLQPLLWLVLCGSCQGCGWCPPGFSLGINSERTECVSDP